MGHCGLVDRCVICSPHDHNKPVSRLDRRLAHLGLFTDSKPSFTG